MGGSVTLFAHFKKQQVIAIGKKTGCDVELHPVEIIYNTPSILLFCRYANALRKLPDPLGRQHLKRSRRGAVLFIQHHLLDSVVVRRLGRLGVFQLVVVHRLHIVVVVGAVRKEHRMHRLQHFDHTRRISTSSKSPGCYGGFENRAEFSTAHSVFFLAISCSCCYCCFQPPSFNPCRTSCYFFRENMKLHFSREQIKKGPYLHFWAPPVQWWGQSRKLDNFLAT